MGKRTSASVSRTFLTASLLILMIKRSFCLSVLSVLSGDHRSAPKFLFYLSLQRDCSTFTGPVHENLAALTLAEDPYLFRLCIRLTVLYFVPYAATFNGFYALEASKTRMQRASP